MAGEWARQPGELIMAKPRVIIRAVANHYTGPTERIIEIAFAGGVGCLIRLREATDTRRPLVEVYRTDDQIDVIAPEAEVRRQAALDSTLAQNSNDTTQPV